MSLTSDDIAQIAERTAALLDLPQSPWRSAKGIAEHLGFTEKTVHNLTGPQADDPIPFHRLTPAGEKRFHIAEVDAWLLQRQRD